MDRKLQKKIVLQGKYEDVIKENDHLYVIHKFDKICVLPYTISSEGIVDQVGVIKELNIEQNKELYTLISGYSNQDDPTTLVGANRLLFEIIGSNVKKADDWMYLGNLSNIAGGSMVLYSANITDLDINEAAEAELAKQAVKFEMVGANKIVSSDDALFLAAYMRLYNYFYINSLKL